MTDGTQVARRSCSCRNGAPPRSCRSMVRSLARLIVHTDSAREVREDEKAQLEGFDWIWSITLPASAHGRLPDASRCTNFWRRAVGVR